MSLALHYWMGYVHHCSRTLVSEMTYTVSSATLNSTTYWCPELLSRPFFRSRDRDLGLQVSRPGTWTLAIRSRDRDLDKMNSSRETMVSKSHHFQDATNYGNCATGIAPSMLSWDRDLGLQVSRPGPSGLETETWTKWTRVSRPWSRDHNTADVV